MTKKSDRVVLGSEQPLGTTRTLLTAEQGGLVKRTVLPGGLRIITEYMPTVRSAAIGIWVNVGSRDEVASQTGSAHYLEHLLPVLLILGQLAIWFVLQICTQTHCLAF